MRRPSLIITTSVGLLGSIVIPTTAVAICRIVNDPEDPPPQIEPDQAVLFLKRTNLEVGDCDGPSDAGVDAGVDGGVDAGTDDAGPGEPDPVACAVIPEAITMVVQPRFRIGADGSSFALLMVTPGQPVITLERNDLFTELAENTRPRVFVEEVYVEDASLGYQCSDPKWGGGGCMGGGSYEPHNSGNDFDPGDPPTWNDPETQVVETVGPYEVARLGATDAGDLAAGLDDLGYTYDQSDLDAIAPYLDLGFAVIAVRVRVEGNLTGGLQPLALTYPGTEMRLPLGISRQEQLAETSIALYVSAEARYDFPGATVTYAQLQSDIQTVLTRSSLIATLDAGPEGDPIAIRDPQNTPARESVTVRQEIRIPSSQCPSSSGSGRDSEGIDLCGCQESSLRGAGNSLFIGLSILGLGLAVRRRRDRISPRADKRS